MSRENIAMIMCLNPHNGTEDCKLVVTCKMQNRNATDKLNQQCTKIALFANTINNANLLHCGFSLSVAFLFCILQVTTNLQSSVQ